MMTRNEAEGHLMQRDVVKKLWPVAAAFFCVYIPVTFFISNDYMAGWILLATFLFFILSMLIYLKTKNVTLITNMLALLGIHALIPWLISGGPGGIGFWWTLVYVVWAFFVSDKKTAFFWLSIHLVLSITIVILSQNGIIKIAYSFS